jgi:hypothetical protein
LNVDLAKILSHFLNFEEQTIVLMERDALRCSIGNKDEDEELEKHVMSITEALLGTSSCLNSSQESLQKVQEIVREVLLQHHCNPDASLQFVLQNPPIGLSTLAENIRKQNKKPRLECTHSIVLILSEKGSVKTKNLHFTLQCL